MFEQVFQQHQQGPPPKPNYWKGLMYECMTPHAEAIHNHKGDIESLQKKYDKVSGSVNKLLTTFKTDNELFLEHQGHIVSGIRIQVDNNRRPHVSIF